MLKKTAAVLMTAALLAGSVSAVLPAAAEGEEDLMPLKAWYTSPAADWESEATPIGNGFIGGMIFGGVESDHIQMNEHTVWSGGPGADPNYNFGINTKSTDARSALNNLRRALQETVSEFTENKSAVQNANGTVTAYDYGYGDRATQIANLQRPLYGNRGAFGYYQTLGDVYINDPSSTVPVLSSATSDYEPAGGEAETADKLFDGSVNSKWFAGNAGKALSFPVTVSWSYSAPMTFSGYSVTSANDDYGRDPSAWKLYGSADGSNYTLIDTRTGVTFRDRLSANEYTLSGQMSFRYFKFEITATGGNNPPQIAEIRLAEVGRQAGYTDYVRALDLRTGTASVQYKQGEVTYTRQYFASYPDNVMAILLTADQAGALTRTVSLTSEQPRKTISAAGDTITLAGQPSDHKTGGLHFAQMIKVIPTGGSMRTDGKTVTVEGADAILLLVAAGTNYRQVTDASADYFTDEDPAAVVGERLEKAAAKGWDALYAAHEADYKELFDRVELDLGGRVTTAKDTAALLRGYKNGSNTEAENRYLETLYYQFGRYLLIASSRAGSLPANLQGIWATGLNPPWNCDYHTNINMQMNYWPAEITNLSECHTPLFDYVNAQVGVGEVYASHYYATPRGGAVRGWALPCGNNIWNHVGSNDTEIGLVPTGAAWLALHLWDHYRFTGDKEFLAANYDTMLGAALFWVDNLWTDTRDNTLVVNPSYSPENGGLSLGTAYDQSIVWEIFNAVLKAGAELGYNTDEMGQIRRALNKLSSPLRIGLAGEFLEWKDETKADLNGSGQHRHVSQLFGLCPGTLVVAGRSVEDDVYAEAMKQALILRGDGGTGWSMAWKINFWARLRDGDHAQSMVNNILKTGTLQNLFDTHPPFQIDGNFGATAGMTEMLLQSQGDSVDLLAALPAAWSSGSVKGLKARGNFTVDMGWEDQQLKEVKITSVIGGDCTLSYYNLSRASVKRVRDGADIPVTAVNAGTVTFPTEAGEEYEIVNIPARSNFSKQVKLWKATFNNLYSDALLKATGCPDGAGAYLESVENNSPAPKMGLQAGDVIRAFNGESVLSGDDLAARVESMADYETAVLTVWRGTGTFETVFAKTGAFAGYSEAFLSLPARLWAGGFNTLAGDTARVEEEGFACIRGTGAQYMYIKFYAAPAVARIEARSAGAGAVLLRLGGARGEIIARFDLTDTGGGFRQFTAPVQNRSACLEDDGERDLFISVEGDVTLKWAELEGGGSQPGDVDGDGSVTSTDARLTLQAAVGKIGESELSDPSAADVDGDASITSTDARLILQKAVDKIEKFPVEEG